MHIKHTQSAPANCYVITYTCTCTYTCTQYGQTALYFAAHYGHEDVVELLLEAMADPNLSDMVTLTLTCVTLRMQVLPTVLCVYWSTYTVVS